MNGSGLAYSEPKKKYDKILFCNCLLTWNLRKLVPPYKLLHHSSTKSSCIFNSVNCLDATLKSILLSFRTYFDLFYQSIFDKILSSANSTNSYEFQKEIFSNLSRHIGMIVNVCEIYSKEYNNYTSKENFKR